MHKPETTMESSAITPGERVHVFLQEKYQRLRGDPLSTAIDNDIIADGEFVELVFQSHINYLTRRFILAATYYRDRYPSARYSPGRYKNELRSYLRDYTHYSDREIDTLVILLRECVDSNAGTGKGNKNKIKALAKEHDRYCSICGISMEYTSNPEDEDAHRQATVDHIWPQSLGGTHDLSNLSVVCSACNNKYKGSRLGYTDFHYEAMASKALTFDKYIEERSKIWDIAVFQRFDCECAVCGAPAERVGRLQVGRQEPSDLWHFLNLAPYCDNHHPSKGT